MLTYSEIQEFKGSLKELWTPKHERCGVILMDRQVIEAENITEDPHINFEFPSGTLETGIASWHTHPYGNANLSIADFYFFKSWPSLFHFIIFNDEVRCYKSTTKGVICIDEEEDLFPWLLEGHAG